MKILLSILNLIFSQTILASEPKKIEVYNDNVIKKEFDITKLGKYKIKNNLSYKEGDTRIKIYSNIDIEKKEFDSVAIKVTEYMSKNSYLYSYSNFRLNDSSLYEVGFTYDIGRFKINTCLDAITENKSKEEHSTNVLTKINYRF